MQLKYTKDYSIWLYNNTIPHWSICLVLQVLISILHVHSHTSTCHINQFCMGQPSPKCGFWRPPPEGALDGRSPLAGWRINVHNNPVNMDDWWVYPFEETPNMAHTGSFYYWGMELYWTLMDFVTLVVHFLMARYRTYKRSFWTTWFSPKMRTDTQSTWGKKQ